MPDSDSDRSRREFLTGHSLSRDRQSLPDPGHSPSADDASAVPVGSGHLLEVGRRAMACEFQVLLNAGQYRHAVDQAVEALDLIERLEAQLSIFREDSELSQLNQSAAERPIVVESKLYALLKYAQEIYEKTSAAFDITAGPLSRIWGFVRRQGRVPTAADVRAALECVGGQHLVFDDERQMIAFARAGMEINLGAIGKGYALDCCAQRLRDAGIGDFLLHGGQSSILAAGSRRGEQGWIVGLRDPLRPEKRIAEIRLRDRALGTSGTANQYFYHQGRRYGHIVDPRTGWPAEELIGTTVLAPAAAEADALATAFFVMGRQGAEAYCAARADLSAVLIAAGPRDGELEIHTIGLAEDDWRLCPSYGDLG